MKKTYNSLDNDEFQSRLSAQTEYKTNDVYNGIHGYLNFKCVNNHVFRAQPNNIFHGQKCPYCSNRKILKGFNDINTLRPDIAQLFVNEEDKYKCGIYSSKTVFCKCQECGDISSKIIKNIVKRGYTCSKCSDGISYPNKFIRALLEQYQLECDFEWQPNWLKPYYYDSHFILNDKHYVVEMDGGIGHGNKNFNGGKANTEIDDKKDKLALKNNVTVIRIDCDYSYGVNRFEYIKNNILKSELSNVLDLSICSFEKCNDFSVSSFIVQTAKLYNEGKSSQDIQRILKCSISSVYNWLQIASQNNMCVYSKEIMIDRSRDSIRKKVDKYTIDGIFVETYISLTEAAKLNDLQQTSISNCCRGINKTAGGFVWKYHDTSTSSTTSTTTKEAS